MPGHHSKFLTRVRDEIDSRTSNWSSFAPTRKFFTDFSYAKSTFGQYVSDKFSAPKKLWRSASSSSLSWDTNMKENFGSLRRSNSYTSLAPSHGVDFADRYVPRYVNRHHVYQPKTDNWAREHAAVEREQRFAAEMKARRQPRHNELMPMYTPPSYKPTTAAVDHRSWPQRKQLLLYPTKMTRYEADGFRSMHKNNGVVLSQAFLYPNYDLDDDRRMHRCHWGARIQTSRYGTLSAPRNSYDPINVQSYRTRRTLMCY